MKFRVAGRDGMQLAEIFYLLQGHVITGQVEPRIKEYGAVPGTENEAVAIDPAGFRGVEHQAFTKENGPNFGCPQREAEMARGAGVDGVHGEAAGLGGGLGKNGGVHEGVEEKEVGFLKCGLG